MEGIVVLPVEMSSGMNYQPQAETPSQEDTVTVSLLPAEGHGDSVCFTALPSAVTLKRVSWLGTFFLLTTDVLGPSNTPWAFSYFGFIPGGMIFVVSGMYAFYAGYLLWHLFLALDGPIQPVRTYRDLGDRLFGRWCGHLVAGFQALQMLLGVAIITLSNSLGLSQIVEFRVCFVWIVVLFTILGMVLGFAKTFRQLGMLARCSVFGTIAVSIITMAGSADVYPWFGDGKPVVAVAFVDSASGTGQLVAAMNMLNNYGGAVLFVELMAEMRNPREFLKALKLSFFIIIGVYLLFGMFVYSQQGQFTQTPAILGVSSYAWRTAGNVINILVHMVAAGMYSTVGLKAIYYSVVVDWWKGPDITSSRGGTIWVILCVLYWWSAFLLAAGIPHLGDLVALVASFCVIQYSFTLPSVFRLALEAHLLRSIWKAIQTRWWDVLIVGIALLLTVAGVYGTFVEIAKNSNDNSPSFGCKSPADPR